MSADTFSKFPDLSAELRRMIWSFCIPGRRVYEIHSALRGYPHIVGAPDDVSSPVTVWWSRFGLFPVISRVCREAREVVLERHVYVDATDSKGLLDDDGVPCPEWFAWYEILPVRFRKGFDVVHLHWIESYSDDPNQPPPPNPLPYFHWLAKQAAAASFSAQHLHAFFGSSYGDRIEDPENVKLFIPHKLYYGVLNVVEVHITDYEAAHAGVFGRLGKEPIQLVDPRDTAAVAALRDVWSRHRSPSEEPEVAKLFSEVLDAAEAYRARVEQWLQELETVWIWYKCQELKVPNATLERIWPDPDRPTGAPIHLGFPFPYRPPDAPTSEGDNSPVLNKERPWVREQLAQMPRFEPALMFRHCPERCWLPRSPWLPLSELRRRSARGAARGARGAGRRIVPIPRAW